MHELITIDHDELCNRSENVQFLSQIIEEAGTLLLQLFTDDCLQLSSISSKTSYSLQLKIIKKKVQHFYKSHRRELLHSHVVLIVEPSEAGLVQMNLVTFRSRCRLYCQS